LLFQQTKPLAMARVGFRGQVLPDRHPGRAIPYFSQSGMQINGIGTESADVSIGDKFNAPAMKGFHDRDRLPVANSGPLHQPCPPACRGVSTQNVDDLVSKNRLGLTAV
jgi:hypothetical protein